MDVLRVLGSHREEIEKRLERFLERKVSEAGEVSLGIKEFVEWVKDFNLRGGKRLRPAFVVVGYQCFESGNLDRVYDISIAVEMMQAHLLIHDDIIDKDILRRGKITLHKAFEEIHRKKLEVGDPEHFGISEAIAVGDSVNTFGYEIILNSNFSSEIKSRVLEVYNRVLLQTCYGQVLDVLASAQPLGSVKEEDVITIHTLKTSKYTLEGPLHMGAILAGASERDMKVLSSYAIPLGIAFQLQDDILGLFGDTQKTGKPVGADVREGKRTLLMVKAWEFGSEKDRDVLNRFLGKKDLTEKELEMVRDVVIRTGSLGYSKELARKYAKEVKPIIERSNFRKEGKDFLLGIADYLIKREW